MDDVCIWSGSKPATSAPAVYELNKEIFLSGGDSGYIIIHTDYARSWNEERDYLYPVPTDDPGADPGRHYAEPRLERRPEFLT